LQDGTFLEPNTPDNQGHRLFKNAALDAIDSVEAFPHFPKEADRLRWTFTIVLDYRLAG
jgi:outer membrane biosynthesis protein TonB